MSTYRSPLPTSRAARLACLLLTGLLSGTLAPPAVAGMGLGPDARPMVKKWADGLEGLSVVEAPVERSRAVVQLASGCRILLAHGSGTDCSGLHMDAGNTRACLNGVGCPEWSDFQRALAAAGPLFLPWRPVAADPVPEGGAIQRRAAALTAEPKTASEALDVARQRLLLEDHAGASTVLLPYIQDSTRYGPTETMAMLPVLAHVGQGAAALGVLGRESWRGVERRVDVLIRLALQLGPTLALAAADPLVESFNACEAVPLAEGFFHAGAWFEAAMLARMARREDATCWPAYLVEAAAWERLERRDSLGTVYNAAKVAFPKQTKRLTALGARTFLVRQEVKAALYLLEQQLAAGSRDGQTVGALMDLYSMPELSKSKAVAFQTRLDADPKDALAAVFAAAIAYSNKEYRRTWELLDRAIAADARLGGVARVQTLAALSALELGDLLAARRAAGLAERADPEDPRALAARAEVWRDEDPMFARRGLEAALRATEERPSMAPLRKALLARLDAARACADRATPGPCEGPWEHKAGAAAAAAP